jgi:transposase
MAAPPSRHQWGGITAYETCKLLRINPHTYFADVLSRIILRKDGDPVDDLLPAEWLRRQAPAADDELAKAA